MHAYCIFPIFCATLYTCLYFLIISLMCVQLRNNPQNRNNNTISTVIPNQQPSLQIYWGSIWRKSQMLSKTTYHKL